ncbi:MAG TPA: hypothetical protein VKX31_00435 [Brumimicrobium sp.]|nr:hypothetical protein [Brumimicrobium sp.]
MTVNELDTEKKRLEDLITSKETKITSLERSATSWEGPAKARNCNKQGYHPVFQKKKIQECEVEKKRQLDKAAGYRKEAAALKSQVAIHKKDLNTVIDSRAEVVRSSAEVARLLAESGKTSNSVELDAEIKAKAAAEAARIAAESAAEASTTQSQVDASNKKIIGLVAAGIGVVIILAIGVYSYRKFKK